MAKFFEKIILSSIFFATLPIFASAATLSIIPGSGTYEVGDIITARVVVSSSASLNAISNRILVSPTFFSIQSVSKAGSILDFWVTEPSFDRTTGIVNFEGVALSGFQGSSGTIATMKLKAIKAGSGKILFQSGQVLANDGEGTDITGSQTGATLTIMEAAEKTSPPEQPAVVEPVEVAETPQPLPSMKAPEIVSGTKYGALSIVGTSGYSKAQTLLTFVAKDGSKIVIIGDADTDGGFNIIVPNSLKYGTYEVSAIMIKADKTNSEKSNSITIKVGNMFSDINPEIIWVILLLILAILYLLARTYQHFFCDKSIHERLRSEAHKAEAVTHKTFDILREDITDYEDEKSAAAKHKIASEIEKDIDSAEKVVEREIKDIESV
jgi:hypothetical protein